jgi:prepilin-type processing-associated H-X9-DG protein
LKHFKLAQSSIDVSSHLDSGHFFVSQASLAIARADVTLRGEGRLGKSDSQPLEILMVRSTARKLLAFTLVELLVVIGIIALLISILLPVLNKVRDEANTVACSAQLRSIMQGVMIYASQNHGSMPYTYALNLATNGAPTPGQVPLSGSGYSWYDRFSWTTLVNYTFTHDKRSGLWPAGANAPTNNAIYQFPQFTKVWTCPSVASDGSVHVDSTQNFSCYVSNPVIMPNQSYEITPSVLPNFGAIAGLEPLYQPTTGTTTSIGPAKQSQLYPDNAVLWEGPVLPAPPGYYFPSTLCGQFNWSCVDGGSLLYPQLSYLRYRGELSNVNPTIANFYTDDKAIWMPTRKEEIETDPTLLWANADSFGTYYTNYFTGPRYRHQKNTVCNVAFADGSVRGLKWNPLKYAFLDSFGREVAVNEFTKGMLRLHPPAPVPGPQTPASNSSPFPEF